MTASATPPSITAFFPAFNDAESIGLLVNQVLEILPRLTQDFEVIVINDGSQDQTAEVIEDIARLNPQVRIVHHVRNLGYGAALRSGFSNARKDLVFYTDGDGQYDVSEMPRLFEHMTDDTYVVNGFKQIRSDDRHRRVIGCAYKHLARIIFKIRIRDVDCDFRLIRRSALTGLDLTSSSGAICLELVYKLQKQGFRFAEVAVSHHPRIHGKSQFFTVRHLILMGIEVAALWLTLFFARDRMSSNG